MCRWVWSLARAVKWFWLSYFQDEKFRDCFGGNKGEVKSVKSAVACIRFILINATRFEADDGTLSAELEQLGLPKEHSTALCRVFSDKCNDIKQYLLDNNFSGKWNIRRSKRFTHNKSCLFSFTQSTNSSISHTKYPKMPSTARPFRSI